MSEDGSDFPPHGLGSVHSRARLFGFSPSGFHRAFVSRIDSIISLPDEFKTAIEIVSR
jgi:hypothetical protein